MITSKVKLKPIRVPNYIMIEGPVDPYADKFDCKLPISEIDEDALSDLCDTFRVEIFAKAGKNDPKSTE